MTNQPQRGFTTAILHSDRDAGIEHGALMVALLRGGDHIVSSQFLFGNSVSQFNSLAALGVGVSFVDATDVDNVEAAITPSTRLVFVETIANPRTQVADLARIGALCA